MFNQVLGAMLVPILLGLVFSFVIESAHPPRPKPFWRRHPADFLIHSGLWLILFLVEFLQFRRPWLASCLTSTIFYVLILINHAKYRALREPFIYQDLEYFLDAIKHPRLYLPFFGFLKIALCLIAVVAALAIGVSIESPLTSTYPAGQVWIACLGILLLAIALLLAGSLRKVALSFKPAEDFKKYGFLAILWLYARAERKCPPPSALAKFSTLPRADLKVGTDYCFASQAKPLASLTLLPNTVVVQSESFFDPRRAFANINPDVLAGFDQACQTSSRFGTLTVPAWGANTVRTEFEFLTGINIADLGIHQFNPYRRSVQNGLPSIAQEFKKRGYRTVCVHPFPATFYQRDKIFPLLGFDKFIDIESFSPTKANTEQSPYISDQALTDKVLEILNQKSTQPLFIFVITVENHGPLNLETITDQETRRWVSEKLPQGCQELPIYLRHLANADQMIVRLIEQLSAATQGLAESRPSQLLWYGDHVPVLPVVYDKLGMPDGLTDYFLWRSDGTRVGIQEPMHSHQLAVELLKYRFMIWLGSDPSPLPS